MLSEKILQCIRENFTLYQSKFYNVSEQVKKNFRMYQSKLNFLRCIKVNKILKDVSEQVKKKILRCIKVNKISKDVSEQVGILKYIRAYLNF